MARTTSRRHGDAELEYLAEVVGQLERFAGNDLTATLARIENRVRGLGVGGCTSFLEEACADRDVLAAASRMKRLAGQVNVTIHALGILRCLPHLLEEGERIEYLSLGAGNTGRKFDLETNLRVAEFKFIHWRGGAESIRQNAIFKDFVLLAEHETTKRKYLYLLGLHHALKFLRGGRSLKSILSRNEKLRTSFFNRFGEQYDTVGDYFLRHNTSVNIEDISVYLPELG